MHMRVKLIEDLPMATSAELYRLSWIIEQLVADPRRIVQARQQLHLGQVVQFWEWGTGKLRPGRMVSMKDSQVTLLDEQSQPHQRLVRGDRARPGTGRGERLEHDQFNHQRTATVHCDGRAWRISFAAPARRRRDRLTFITAVEDGTGRTITFHS